MEAEDKLIQEKSDMAETEEKEKDEELIKNTGNEMKGKNEKRKRGREKRKN